MGDVNPQESERIPLKPREIAQAITRGNSCKTYPYDSSEYVAYYDLFSPGWRIPAARYNESVLMDFEGRKFRCPKGYDEVLKMQYGDYMMPPPENEQITHHQNNVYWRNKPGS